MKTLHISRRATLHLLQGLCLLLLLLPLSACRSSKQSTGGLTQEQLGTARTRYEAVVARNTSYTTMQAKVKYGMEGKSLGGRLYIDHGKRVTLTVTVLGIEVARIEATPDQVLVVDKVDKVYARSSIAEAAARIGLQDEARLETLEALLLGRMYLPGSGEAAKGDFAKFAWYPMEGGEMQADYLTERYQLSYVLDAANQLVATQVRVPHPESTFVWEYAEPMTLEQTSVPAQHTLTASGSRSLSATLTLSAPALGKKAGSAFRATDAYREVTFAELLEIIKNLKH